ncbi:MAG: hypothetical protein HC880_20955 [Bacteroidia bacterium]|nr:hypothetical protein [Bacteroidia bacterium]
MIYSLLYPKKFILFLPFFLILAGVPFYGKGQSLTRPNILFILTDDQAPWGLGLENPQILTPTLDSLATQVPGSPISLLPHPCAAPPGPACLPAATAPK